MRQFVITAAALTLLAATAGTAAAFDGAPVKQGAQCFQPAKTQEREGRFGSWVACPQPASTAVAPATRRRAQTASAR